MCDTDSRLPHLKMAERNSTSKNVMWNSSVPIKNQNKTTQLCECCYACVWACTTHRACETIIYLKIIIYRKRLAFAHWFDQLNFIRIFFLISLFFASCLSHNFCQTHAYTAISAWNGSKRNSKICTKQSLLRMQNTMNRRNDKTKTSPKRTHIRNRNTAINKTKEIERVNE